MTAVRRTSEVRDKGDGRRAARSYWGRRSTVGKFVIAGLALVVVAGAATGVALVRFRAGMSEWVCPANLRQLGFAMELYAKEHDGSMPTDFATLMAATDLTPNAFVCPVSGDRAAFGPTPQTASQALIQPGRCSYVLAPGLPPKWADVTAAHVLAHERPGNHGANGISALFGDGHVEFLRTPETERVLSELQAGHNPPRPAGVGGTP